MLNFNKKRALAFALSFVLVGSTLAACSGDDTPETTAGAPSTTAATEVVDDTTAPAETTAEAGETETATETEGEPDDSAADDTETEAAETEGEETEETLAQGEVFDAVDLGGQTIVALNINSLGGTNPDIEDENLDDLAREERREHLDRIQEKYNVTIEYNDAPDVEWHEVGNELVTAYTSGQPYADIMDFSYLYLMTMINNNALHDDTDWIKDAPYASRYTDTTTWLGSTYGIATIVGGEGLLYNRTMIEEAGMEFEPNEMFARGEWSYDDFQAYLEELNANLPEDTFPFFIDPYYWFLYAPAANGTELINDEVGANYQDPAIVETLTFLDTIYDAGLVREPNLNDEGNPSYWGTPGATFDQGVEVAMTHRASWQAAGLTESLDFGFVPYPWGSNVTVEQTGDNTAYLTLSDNYVVSSHDTQTKVMVNGIEEKGNPEDIFTMFMDLIKHDFMVTEYEAEQNQTEEEDREIDPRWFSTELDAELYDWSTRRERLERYSGLRSILSLAGDYYDVFFEDASVQAVIDAAQPVDQAELEENGYLG